ncbi:MAG: hypothetical protein K2K77_01845 [Duncaniella sp.]|nr:hypothetical protein [Duncaniella sp.]
MKLSFFFPIATACIYCLTACSDKSASTAENQGTDSIKYEIPEEYKLSNRFTPEQVDSIINMSRIIYQNLRISDDSTYYILELTEEEAIKAGVTKEFYDDAVESITSTNAAYKEALAEGAISDRLMTPEQLLEAVDHYKR